ncbi:MAG: hypothetical protein ACHQ9S_20050 [Candidatus Binatia bacterium]
MGKIFYHRLTPVALIVLAVLAGFLRPISRVPGRAQNQFGLNRLAFLLEPATDAALPLAAPARADARTFAPTLASTFLIVLKMRRVAFVPVPVRRLRLPSRTTSRSLPSD